jgi:hypothetical protein
MVCFLEFLRTKIRPVMVGHRQRGSLEGYTGQVEKEWESSRSRREDRFAYARRGNQTAVVVARFKDDWMAGRGEKVEGFVIY